MPGAKIPECLTTAGDECQPVQLEVLCDDNGPFLRRYQINCDNGAILGVVDTLLNGTTLYAPVGTITVCAESLAVTVEARQLCDLGSGLPGFQTSFLRVEVRDEDGALLSSFDVEADGVTPYVVVGPVDFDCDCLECLETEISPRRENLAGVSSWAMPANTQAVTVKVRAVGAPGSVTITDNAANTTAMFMGDEETWDAGDNLLATPFTVDLTDAGDSVTILYEVLI
jgi:hypothetical protein